MSMWCYPKRKHQSLARPGREVHGHQYTPVGLVWRLPHHEQGSCCAPHQSLRRGAQHQAAKESGSTRTQHQQLRIEAVRYSEDFIQSRSSGIFCIYFNMPPNRNFGGQAAQHVMRFIAHLLLWITRCTQPFANPRERLPRQNVHQSQW